MRRSQTLLLQGGVLAKPLQREFREAHAVALASGRGAVWIVKPGGRNRGNGIVLVDSPEALAQHMAKQVQTRACIIAC